MRAPSIRLLLIAALLCGGVLSAQNEKSAKPSASAAFTYDVATIKPNKEGSFNTSISSADGKLDATNVSLKTLLRMAFYVREDQIFGLPSWAEHARYDIAAKVVDGDPKVLEKLTRDERRTMLRKLLVERFGIKYHMEEKELPIFELVVVGNGPNLKKCPTDDGDGGTSQNNQTLTAHDVPLFQLADILSEELHRTVIDKTGLKGNYNYTLKWTRDDEAGAGQRDVSPDAPPVLFTALQEQLGLKLKSTKGPVPTLVIDHMEEPTEN